MRCCCRFRWLLFVKSLWWTKTLVGVSAVGVVRRFGVCCFWSRASDLLLSLAGRTFATVLPSPTDGWYVKCLSTRQGKIKERHTYESHGVEWEYLWGAQFFVSCSFSRLSVAPWSAGWLAENLIRAAQGRLSLSSQSQTRLSGRERSTFHASRCSAPRDSFTPKPGVLSPYLLSPPHHTCYGLSPAVDFPVAFLVSLLWSFYRRPNRLFPTVATFADVTSARRVCGVRARRTEPSLSEISQNSRWRSSFTLTPSTSDTRECVPACCVFALATDGDV